MFTAGVNILFQDEKPFNIIPVTFQSQPGPEIYQSKSLDSQPQKLVPCELHVDRISGCCESMHDGISPSLTNMTPEDWTIRDTELKRRYPTLYIALNGEDSPRSRERYSLDSTIGRSRLCHKTLKDVLVTEQSTCQPEMVNAPGLNNVTQTQLSERHLDINSELTDAKRIDPYEKMHLSLEMNQLQRHSETLCQGESLVNPVKEEQPDLDTIKSSPLRSGTTYMDHNNSDSENVEIVANTLQDSSTGRQLVKNVALMSSTQVQSNIDIPELIDPVQCQGQGKLPYNVSSPIVEIRSTSTPSKEMLDEHDVINLYLSSNTEIQAAGIKYIPASKSINPRCINSAVTFSIDDLYS